MSQSDLREEIERLKQRLRESEETLAAICQGQVDAIVVDECGEARVYTLQTAERIYRTIIEQMNEAAATLSPEGTILFCNPALGRLVGLGPDELVGSALHDLVSPQDRESVRSMRRDALREGSRREVALFAEDGTAIPVFLSLRSLEGTDPPILSLVATDLREQKRSERVVEAGRLAGSILENIGEAVVVCDRTGIVTHVSRVVREMIRHDPIGRHIDDLFDLRVARGAAGMPVRLGFSEIERGGLKRIEASIRSEQSRVFDLLLTTALLHGAHGQEIGLVLTMVDITSRKTMEQDLLRAKSQLEEANRDLEDRVTMRTAELEQASRAKDEFLANMSHELRTPLSGVLGLTDILLHQNLPGKVRDDLEMIRSSAESVMALVNDLFDLSRISQGKLQLHPAQFDLRTMIEEALGPFRYQAMAKDLDFIVSIDEAVPDRILCDRGRLGQVFKNLVSNAIKFTDHGFVRVEVTSETLEAETLRLSVTVSDSGIGIPKNKQMNVFDAFTQLDPSYSKRFAGMGLGLSISKSLVEGMGGEISLSSTKGKGATFRFSIVCGRSSPEQGAAAEEMSLADLPTMTVLLVEDNPVNRLFLRRAFLRAGHPVVEARHGREALEKLSLHPINLVLMDIQMPEMDGVEATRRIRAGAGGKPEIPVIALTAYAMKGDREKFLKNGFDGYVTKPVNFRELARTIAHTLGAAARSTA